MSTDPIRHNQAGFQQPLGFFAQGVLHGDRLSKLPGAGARDEPALSHIIEALGDPDPANANSLGRSASCLGQALLMSTVALGGAESALRTSLDWAMSRELEKPWRGPPLALTPTIGRAHPAREGYHLFTATRPAGVGGGHAQTLIIRARMSDNTDSETPDRPPALFMVDLAKDESIDPIADKAAMIVRDGGGGRAAFAALQNRARLAHLTALLTVAESGDPSDDIRSSLLGLRLAGTWLAMHIDLSERHPDRTQQADSTGLVRLLLPALLIEAEELALQMVMRNDEGSLRLPEPSHLAQLQNCLVQNPSIALAPRDWWRIALLPVYGQHYRPFMHPLDTFLRSIQDEESLAAHGQKLEEDFNRIQKTAMALRMNAQDPEATPPPKIIRQHARQLATMGSYYLLLQTALVADGAAAHGSPTTIDWWAHAEGFLNDRLPFG